MNAGDARSSLSSPGGLLALPYSERQKIVVVPDTVADSAARIQHQEAEGSDDWLTKAAGRLKVKPWWPMAASVARVVPVIATPIVAVTLYEAWKKSKNEGVDWLLVRRSDAASLQFPVGHPRTNVLYVGHPAIATTYYPAALFHRLTFEHKFTEAVAILISLGATEIRVQHDRGYARSFLAGLNVPLSPGISTGLDVGAEKKHGAQLLFEASLEGSKHPALPDGLVWYYHEPTWQQIAEACLEHSLRQFSLVVSYEDDFGVNARLKVAAEGIGLDLGGSFENHESTRWDIQGSFG